MDNPVNFARTLTWAELLDRNDMYRDFPKMRAASEELAQACHDEQNRRVALKREGVPNALEAL